MGLRVPNTGSPLLQCTVELELLMSDWRKRVDVGIDEARMRRLHASSRTTSCGVQRENRLF